MKKKNDDAVRVVAENRRARYQYFIGEVIEAGIVLTGTEVKSLREGRAAIAESYASPEDGAVFLVNADIPVYSAGNRENHTPKRRRKLLLHRRQMARFTLAVERKGNTIVPLRLYFNKRGIAKLEIGLAKGKKLHDKREGEKRRDWARQKQRLLRERG